MEKADDLFATTPEYYLVYGKEPGWVETPEVSESEMLMNTLRDHKEEESKLLERYQAFVHESGNPMVQFLLRLILSDEERHHGMVRSMVSTLEGDLHWTRNPDALHGFSGIGKEEPELLAVTEGFIAEEKRGIEECKKLMTISRDYYCGLFDLLLKYMIHDSEKHIAILEFLRRKLKED